jgi:hypothetical protein
MGVDANIWRQCLDYIRSSRCTDLDALAREEAVYHMNPPPQILYRHCEDRRLLPEANPTYGKYVPFLIPYVSFSEKELTFGEEQIAVDFAQHGHATAFLEKLEVALHFLFSSGNAAVVPSQLSKEEALAFLGHNMPIGFGIYVPGQESAVIDAFETVRTKFLETMD